MNAVERVLAYTDITPEAPQIIDNNRTPKNWPNKGWGFSFFSVFFVSSFPFTCWSFFQFFCKFCCSLFDFFFDKVA